ncbi:glycosyltransferase [Phyllobacterium myrsinacearum]|uniref:Glycosyltransferase involved in cell wall biosynthesis n=1 Tax=Phyllobacterium myrsinacearum TaxID=28101 RepID=A0A839EDM5_9HYPH|nr:glycosyltransferase [Phyllobacterium myrsinacearum]MBA8876829.1 glycosyltransferase involved in cell wall biosynthesis [Phyllobacterium myrsinacearum]
MKRAPSSGTVAVLLGTFNGAAFLDGQLASIAAQTYPDIDLWISDDGSTDESRLILQQWAKCWTKGRVTLLPGPGEGRAENIRSLITNPAIQADYYAFADQDDIWEPEKLATSIRWIEHNAFAVPSVFCSRTLKITDNGAIVGSSPLYSQPTEFRNALVQNIAGGNTMLFNRMAHALLVESCRTTPFSSHDWWLYLIVSGAGGVVHFDPQPLVRDRQPNPGEGWQAQLAVLRSLFADRFADQADINIQGLVRNRDLLTSEAQAICDLYWKVRSDNFIRRILALHQSGVYRQTLPGQIGLYLAAVFRRL